jgi:hypothetical protein
MHRFDLAVAYRIYPGIGKPVAVFGNDKLKLTEFAFKSFLNSLGNLKIKLYVILDSCPKAYKEIIQGNFPQSTIIEMDKAGNFKTFETQIDLLLNQNDSELIYFAEDDYFYIQNSSELATNFYLTHNPSFLTLYYHPDYLNWEIHNLSKPQGITYSNYFWQFVGSTTLTFLTNRNDLTKAKNVFLTFGKRNFDCSLWLSLTKRDIFSPKFYLLPLSSKKKKFYFKVIAKMWYFNWFQSIFGQKFFINGSFPFACNTSRKRFSRPKCQMARAF